MKRVVLYLAQLLWSWSLPFVVGMAWGTLLSIWQVQAAAPMFERVFGDALAKTVAQCLSQEVPHG